MRFRMFARLLLIVFSAPALAHEAAAQADAARGHYSTLECPSCAEWNTPQQPVRIFGNTYWVGTHALGSILITSDRGDVLIDGAIPESAPLILANIRALGFNPQDVKLILNSHAHFDHAGGIAELQRATGAQVAASPWSAAVMRRGASDDRDPQYSTNVNIPHASNYPPVGNVRTIRDGETVHVGPLALTAHFTPGHTPGGTTWTWRSCEGDRCLDIVYADSQTPVVVGDFQYTNNKNYPTALQDFARSADTLERLRCDILITPHPGASSFWERLAARDSGNADALIDPTACKRFAADARKAVAARVAAERGKP